MRGNEKGKSTLQPKEKDQFSAQIVAEEAMGNLSHHQERGNPKSFTLRFLQVPSNLCLNISRNGTATDSMATCARASLPSQRSIFFIISNLNIPFVSVNPFLLVLSFHIFVVSLQYIIPWLFFFFF